MLIVSLFLGKKLYLFWILLDFRHFFIPSIHLISSIVMINASPIYQAMVKFGTTNLSTDILVIKVVILKIRSVYQTCTYGKLLTAFSKHD